MPYKHGIFVQEQATSILPPVTVDAGIPMIVGTAPVGMVDETNVNKPVLCHTYAEAVAAFGFVPAETDGNVKRFKYSICEAVYTTFALYGVAPIIIVNVLDPAKHRKDAKATTVAIDATSGSAVIGEPGIIESSVRISKTDGESTVTYTAGTDYDLAYNEDGYLVVSSLADTDGKLKLPTDSELTFSAAVTDPGAVTSEDVIGGVNASGEKSGWELIDDVFPQFRIVPGTLIAPGYSGNSAVAAVMAAKAASINGLFKAVSIVDVPTNEARQYSAVPSWKNQDNIVSTHQMACWPCLSLDGTVYSFSSHLAPLMARTDIIELRLKQRRFFQRGRTALHWRLGCVGQPHRLLSVQYGHEGCLYSDPQDVQLDWEHDCGDLLVLGRFSHQPARHRAHCGQRQYLAERACCPPVYPGRPCRVPRGREPYHIALGRHHHFPSLCDAARSCPRNQLRP